MGKRAKVPDDGLTFDYGPLRRRRRELDVTQRGLSALVGGDANTIGEIERGNRRMEVDQLWRAARALGTPVLDLLNVRDSEGQDGNPRRRITL
jgi:transcriptional regulator with XRE-family HTH domain